LLYIKIKNLFCPLKKHQKILVFFGGRSECFAIRSCHFAPPWKTFPNGIFFRGWFSNTFPQQEKTPVFSLSRSNLFFDYLVSNL